MVQCPVCSANINQEFGMVTCGDCQAVFMIDFSGNVEFGVEDGVGDESLEASIHPPVADGSDSSFSEAPSDFEREEDSQDFHLPGEEHSPFSADVGEEPENGGFSALEELQVPEDGPDSPMDGEFVDDREGASIPGEFFDPPEGSVVGAFQSEEPGALVEEQSWAESEERPGSLSGAVLAQEAQAPDTNPIDITGFARGLDGKDASSDYLYTLTLDHIDSKLLRESVGAVLSDPKLGLDGNKIMARLHHGRLEIPDLHPLKAKIILEQVQYYEIDVRWTQRAVIMDGDDVV